MRKLLLLLGLLITLGDQSAWATPAEDYLKARLLMSEADSAEKAGKNTRALEKYSAALEILQNIQKKYPDWEPKPTQQHIKYCMEHIVQNGGPIQTLAQTEKTPPKSKPTSSSTTPAKGGTSSSKAKTSKTSTASASTTKKATGNKTPSASNPSKAQVSEAKAKPTATQTKPSAVASKTSIEKKTTEKSKSSATPLSEERLQALLEENNTLKKSLETAQEEIANSKRSRSKEWKEDLKITTEEIKKTDETNERRFQALLKENKILKERLHKAEKEIKQDLHSNLEEMTSSFKNELSKAHDQLEKMQKENERLRAKNEESRKTNESHDERLKAILDENQILKDKLNKMETSIEGVRSSLEEFNSVKAELAKTNAQLEKLQNENDALRVSSNSMGVAELNHERLVPPNARSNTDEKPQNVATDLDSMKKELAIAKAVHEAMQRQNDELREAIAAAKKEPAKPLNDLPTREELMTDAIAQVETSRGTEGLENEIPKFIGRVVVLKPSEDFAVIDFQDRKLPAAQSVFGVYREGQLVGKVRITGPFKPPFAPADILSGTLKRGDLVH